MPKKSLGRYMEGADGKFTSPQRRLVKTKIHKKNRNRKYLIHIFVESELVLKKVHVTKGLTSLIKSHFFITSVY